MRLIISLAVVLLLRVLFRTSNDMEAEFLKDTTDAQCNDGSSPLYYKRINRHSSEWLIFLEGGGFCYDHDSCLDRYALTPYYMTGKSDQVPLKVDYPGIFSIKCDTNPVFCKYNVFILHYCSSDEWSGNKEHIPSESDPDIFRFHGQNILKGMIKQIVQKYPDIKKASRIILGGASAGALGVQNQGDLISSLLSQQIGRSNIDIRLLSDSAWFQPGRGYIRNYCAFQMEPFCNLEYMTKQATEYMDLQFDESCVAMMGHKHRWKCGFPIEKGVLEEIKTPTFYIIYLYDQFQMGSDGIPKYSAKQYTEAEEKWAIKRKDAITDRIAQIEGSQDGFYGINCLYHVTIIFDSQINALTVDNQTMSEALQEWLEGKHVKLVDDKCGDAFACNPQCPVIPGME